MAASERTRAVLVIDDDPRVRAVAELMIEELGMRPLLAANSRAGVAALEAEGDAIACVLLDSVMPPPDGEDTLGELYRVRPDARVVLMSGYGRDQLAAALADKRLAGFLQKPFKLEDLEATLRKVLGA